MIKNINRLKKNKHFKYVYKHGETKSYNVLMLTFVKSKIWEPKVGFSVSKKIGKSVVRNKVKRRLRSAFCELYPYVAKKYNYIFTAKSGIENLSYFEILENMKTLLIKNNLYEQNSWCDIIPIKSNFFGAYLCV